MTKTRKGFTLVELLIVIIIIGILAAAMLLSSASASASADASNVVSNLRALKSASLLWYADKNNMASITIPTITDVETYMDNPSKLYGYSFVANAADGAWWISCDLATANISSSADEVAFKLAGKKTAIGLYGAPVLKNTMTANKGDFLATQSVVYMIAH